MALNEALWTKQMKELSGLADGDFSLFKDPYYEAFIKNSGQELIVDWIKENFGTVVVKRLGAKFFTEKEIHLFGVGSGRGKGNCTVFGTRKKK